MQTLCALPSTLVASPRPGIFVLKLHMHSSLPRPCFAKSVCLHWSASVFMSVHPLSSCLSASSPHPTPPAAPQGRYQEPSSCSKLEFPQRSHIQWLWQLSFSGFLAGGAGCLGRVSSSGLSDRACWNGVEKQKPTLPLHPSLRRKRQAREGAGFGRAAKGRLAGGRPAHTHLTHAHTARGRALYCGLELGLENSPQPPRTSIGRG